jgi:hypothetical protein
LTKVIAGSTTAVLAIGLAVVGVAAPASAHTPNFSSTCSVLTVNLSDYSASVPAKAAEGYTEYNWSKTTTVTKTQVGSPGTGWVQGDAVQWEFQHGTSQGHTSTAWHDSPTWNSEDNQNLSDGWVLTGNIQYTWTLTTTQTQWAQISPGSGWVKGASRFVVTKAAVPAKTNHVTVTIDGVIKADVDFSTSYSNTFTYANSTSAHNWRVQVTAWDGSQYNEDTSGTSKPCATPVAPSYTAAVCTGPGTSGDGSYTIPTVAGIEYQVRLGGTSNGSGGGYADKGAGTYALVVGTTIHVIADNLNGFTLTGDDGPWNFTATSAGACLSDVTPAAPTFTAEVCTTPGDSTAGSYVIPATTGVVYSVKINSAGYVTKAAGTYTAADGDVIKVQAAAASGYSLTGYTIPWTFTFADAGQCLAKATPVAPTIVTIVKCGTEGSVTPATTTGVTYTVSPAGVTSGQYTVTATANTGYYFAQDATKEWSGNLGVQTDCVTPVKPAVTDAVCDVATGTLTSGTITIPATTGVSYVLDGFTATTGEHKVRPGNHTVSALAVNGYTLEGDDSWTLTVVAAGDCFTPVTPAAATPSAETCVYATGALTSGYITIPVAEHVTFTVDGGSYDAGNHDFAKGDHTVIVIADAGYVLVGSASYVVTIESAGECLTPVTPTDPSAQDQVCDLESLDGGVTDGYITIGDTEFVDYTIDGHPAVAGQNVVDPGEHVVVATAKDGYRLDPQSETSWTWTVTVAAADNCDFNPPTLAEFEASASATNQLCTAGSTTSGFISVVFPEVIPADAPSAVRYFIGDQELTAANTAVAPGTYTVTAVPRDPADTIIGDNTWTLTVAAVGASCGELKTLAFTGVNGNLSGMIMLAMFLLIGGAGVYTSTRVRLRKN